MTIRDFCELCYLLASIIISLCAFYVGYWIGKNERNDKVEADKEGSEG